MANRNAINKHWDIIVAFKDGAEIQYKDTADRNKWKDTTGPSFNETTEYRLKPVAPPPPTIRAYNDQEAMTKIGQNVLEVETGNVYAIVGFNVNNHKIAVGPFAWVTGQELLDKYTYIDGSKCGITL